MGRKIIKTESLKMSEAFEYYYSIGDERNYDKVALQFQCTSSTIFNWSNSFNWMERVQQRDITIAQEMSKRTIKEVQDTKANYRKIIKLSVAKFISNLQATDPDGNNLGLIKINSVQDLERLVKLDLLLMGEVTQIAQISGAVALTESDKVLVNNLVEAMKGVVQEAIDEDNEDVGLTLAEVGEDDE